MVVVCTCNFFGKVHKEAIVLSCLGEGLGKRIPIHTVSVVSHPKQNKTNNNKELNRNLQFIQKENLTQFPSWNFRREFYPESYIL